MLRTLQHNLDARLDSVRLQVMVSCLFFLLICRGHSGIAERQTFGCFDPCQQGRGYNPVRIFTPQSHPTRTQKETPTLHPILASDPARVSSSCEYFVAYDTFYHTMDCFPEQVDWKVQIFVSYRSIPPRLPRCVCLVCRRRGRTLPRPRSCLGWRRSKCSSRPC